MPTPYKRTIRSVLTDDKLWRQRNRSYRSIARALGCHAKCSSVRQDAYRRGWRKDGTGRTTHAPCRECERSRPVVKLSARRVCVECRPENETYRKELRLFLERHPEYRSAVA